MLRKTRKDSKPKSLLLAVIALTVLFLPACALPATIASFVEKGVGFNEPPYTVEKDPDEVSDPSGPGRTLTQILAEQKDFLIMRKMNCNSALEQYYYPCLEEAMKGGADANAAVKKCSLYLDGLMANDRGGEITISDSEYYYRDKDNFFGITYQSKGGPVEGVVSIAFTEGDPASCSIQISYSFSGQYDPKTCTFSGSGTYVSEFSGDYCIGHTNSQYETPWQAKLEDGRISGSVENSAINFNYSVR